MAKFAKTKGLSKTEKYMIKGMLLEDHSTEDIAKYLDREVELVKGFIEDNKPKEEPVEMQEAPVQHPTQHIINKTGRGNKGVAVMTPAGSERGDESHKRHSRGIHQANSTGYVHKIK